MKKNVLKYLVLEKNNLFYYSHSMVLVYKSFFIRPILRRCLLKFCFRLFFFVHVLFNELNVLDFRIIISFLFLCFGFVFHTRKRRRTKKKQTKNAFIPHHCQSVFYESHCFFLLYKGQRTSFFCVYDNNY